MSATDVLTSVQFIVNEEGEPTAAVVDIVTWNRLVALLEGIEDLETVSAYLQQRAHSATPEEMGLLSWEDVEKEIEALVRE